MLVPKYSRALAMGLGAVARYVYAVDAATLAEDQADAAAESDEPDDEKVVRANGAVHGSSSSSSSGGDGTQSSEDGTRSKAAASESVVPAPAADEVKPEAKIERPRPTFLNPFTLRTLPHVIGTYTFEQSDEDVGISYPGWLLSTTKKKKPEITF